MGRRGASRPQEPKLGAPVTALLVALCSLVPARALATEAEDFQIAEEAYLRGEYDRAVRLFEAMVGGVTPSIRDPILIRESHKYLGAGYVLTGQRDLAARQFESYLRVQGEEYERYSIDETAFPEQVLAVFEGVRRRLVRERDDRITRDRARAAEAEERRRAAALDLLGLAQEQEVVVPHEPAIAWVPFGAGQFQNGNPDLGTFFLVSQAATFVVGVAALAAYIPVALDYQRTLRPGGGPSPVDLGLVRALHATHLAAIGAFGVLAVAGIVEAVASYVPSHTVRRRREIPDDLIERLDLAVGPGWIALRGSF